MGHKAKHKPVVSTSLITNYGNKKTIIFAIGECEHFYTDGKIWHLVKRIAIQHPEWNVIGMTHDKAQADVGKKIGVQTWVVDINSSSPGEEQRLLATDKLIQITKDVLVPLTDECPNLSLAKILALDDFAGSFSLLDADPKDKLIADCIVLPITGVDNNTKPTAGFYAWLAVQAHEHNIPVVGLEVSPLGNKHRFSQLPASVYAVKQLWSQEVLIQEKRIPVFVLPPEEAYLLRAGQQTYMSAYIYREAEVRNLLKIPKEEFVIVIPHHVTFIWDIRKILEALVGWQENMCVVIRADPGTVRRGMTEVQLAVRSYSEVLRKFRHSVVDGAVGVGLLLHLANVFIAPFSSTITEQARMLGIPTIICQPGGSQGYESALVKWESIPERVPEQLSLWRFDGVFDYISLGDIIERQLHEKKTCTD